MQYALSLDPKRVMDMKGPFDLVEMISIRGQNLYACSFVKSLTNQRIARKASVCRQWGDTPSSIPWDLDVLTEW